LARQISIMEMFTDVKNGITVNPGVIRGGTRTNVVAAEAEVELDVRIRRQRDAAKVTKWLHQLKPFDRRCKLEVRGGINRPPMERSRGIAQLFTQAQALAREIGAAEGHAWKLQEAATGGASDGNFTAALGIATLDGLGGVGEGPHARNESVLIREMPRRAALLAALMATSQTS
jgi:glutamate carboxypeptidase